jgi:hypothetical protein
VAVKQPVKPSEALQTENTTMATEIIPPPGVAAVHAVGAEAPGTVTQPTAQPTQQEVRSQSDSRVQVLTNGAFKKLKEAERNKGKRDALAELDAQAKAAGFASFSEVLGAIKNNQTQPRRQTQVAAAEDGSEAAPGPAPTPPARNADRRSWERYEKQRLAWEKDRLAYRDMLAQERSRRRDLQRQIDAKDAEMALRESAVACGVRDVDYAVRLLTRHLEGRSQEEMTGFDERKFFDGLRAERPYLFGETTVPANTGTAGQSATTPGGTPAPKNQTPAINNAGKFDARNMTKEQIAARLRQLGIQSPSM